MAQDLQLIATGLSKSPFNKKVNILDVDSLEGSTATKFLNDVFVILDPTQPRDIDAEPPQDTAVRFFTFLRLLRYPSPESPDEKSIWRQDVVEGRRRTILAILLWIIKNLPMVQQRLYLAKYMTRVDVPSEIRADSDINAMYEEQDHAIANFATIHKQYTTLKHNADEVDRIRDEIKDLRAQKEQAEKRVNELVNQVRSTPGKNDDKENRMILARMLREEREQSGQLADKKVELLQLKPLQNEQIKKLEEYTGKITDDWLDMNPEKLLKRMEDRLHLQRRAVNEVLPKVLEDEKSAVAELRELMGQSDFGDRNLNELRIKAQMLQTEIFNLSDKLRQHTQNPAHNQLNFHRSQSETIESKKRDLTLKNDSLYKEVRKLENKLKQKRLHEGESMEDIDADVASLSAVITRNNDEYEKKKLVLQNIENEKNVMEGSKMVLMEECDRINYVLMEWEKRTGISPFKPSSTLSDQSSSQLKKDAATLARDLRDLEQRISVKRTEISTFLKDLQPIRDKYKQQQEMASAEKERFQLEIRQFSGTLEQSEKDVVQLRKEVDELEAKLYQNQHEKKYAELLLTRATDGASTQQFLQVLNESIEKESSKLTELQTEQENAKASYAENTYQASAWRDLDHLFDMKLDHLKQDMDNLLARSRGGSATERIVMN